MEDQVSAAATDLVVELFGGIHLRYASVRCSVMQLRSCDFWRLTNDASVAGMAGLQQGGSWAC
eukprot:2458349-Lingulodinium_polyedra.AAC.1